MISTKVLLQRKVGRVYSLRRVLGYVKKIANDLYGFCVSSSDVRSYRSLFPNNRREKSVVYPHNGTIDRILLFVALRSAVKYSAFLLSLL